jgi:hypothetical protein
MYNHKTCVYFPMIQELNRYPLCAFVKEFPKNPETGKQSHAKAQRRRKSGEKIEKGIGERGNRKNRYWIEGI